MKRKTLQAEEKEKAQLIKMLRELKAKLGRTPDIYDWVLSTSKPWWHVFRSWSAFLEQGGLSDGKTVVLPDPGERKLYKVLKKLEHRTNKTITENDWYMLVDGGKNERQVPSFYKYFAPYIQKARRWPRQRWNTKAYLADKSGFYRPISTQGCWLSFRYAAGLQDYTADDLVALGIELLKGIRNISSNHIRIKKLSGSEVAYTISFNGVSYTERKEFSVPHSAKELMQSGSLRIFLDFLPHLAIYDHFGTLESYIEVVFQAYDEALKTASSLRGSNLDESSVEELLTSIKILSDELSRRIGMDVQVRIVQ
ncbi:hypothetical protein IKE80_01130 [Candidatus Saccharibacteria bacterium]|nr:hypothetical protein [Candidatus Saccharibacteria bacterium]